MRDTTRGFRAYSSSRSESSYWVSVVMAAIFATVGWYWLLFFSGYFDIRHIEMENLVYLDRGEILQELERGMDDVPWRPWHRRNIFMLQERALAQKLKERLFIDDIRIEKSYPNILRLMMQEKQRSIVLVSQDQYMTVDANGIVTNEAEGDVLRFAQLCVQSKAFLDNEHVPVIVMPTEEPLSTGFGVASAGQIRRWIDISRRLIASGMKFRVIKVERPDANLGRLVSQRGYEIYVALDQPLEPQIKTYVEFMKSKPNETKITEYIDIRVPGKVFLK